MYFQDMCRVVAAFALFEPCGSSSIAVDNTSSIAPLSIEIEGGYFHICILENVFSFSSTYANGRMYTYFPVCRYLCG